MEKIFGRPLGLRDVPFSYCPGCTHGIVHRLIGEVLAELGIIGQTIGVASVGCSAFAMEFFACDFVQALHGRAPAVATGVKRALPHRLVFTYQGDGDIAAIGTSHAIHAAARGERITTIMINNAIYGMTGGQMAPTSLPGMVTTTSPYGRDAATTGYPLDFPQIIAVLPGAAYVATVAADSPQHVIEAKKAIRKAFRVQQAGLGYSLVSVLSACPTNWGLPPVEALAWLRDKLLPAFRLGELKVAEEAKNL